MTTLIKRIVIAFFVTVLLSVAAGYLKGYNIYYLKSLEDYKFKKLYLTEEEYKDLLTDTDEKKYLVKEHTFHLKSALMFGVTAFSISALLLTLFSNKRTNKIKKDEIADADIANNDTYGMSAEIFKTAKLVVQRIQSKESSFQDEIQKAILLFKKLSTTLQHKGDALHIENEFRQYFNYVAVHTNNNFAYETYFSNYPVVF